MCRSRGLPRMDDRGAALGEDLDPPVRVHAHLGIRIDGGAADGRPRAPSRCILSAPPDLIIRATNDDDEMTSTIARDVRRADDDATEARPSAERGRGRALPRVPDRIVCP